MYFNIIETQSPVLCHHRLYIKYTIPRINTLLFADDWEVEILRALQVVKTSERFLLKLTITIRGWVVIHEGKT